MREDSNEGWPCETCGRPYVRQRMEKCPYCYITELEGEIKRLREGELSVPNWFWDDRCLEPISTAKSIEEAIDSDDPGDVIPLRPLHELPTVWVLVGRDGYTSHATQEAAESEQVAQAARKENVDLR